MLTGPQLGAAIEAARLAKNMSKKALAEQFGVKPPSVQGWINTGRIDKAKLIELISFFSGVVGAEHWGLSEKEAELIAPGSSPQRPGSSAAEKVMEMLQRHGKGLSGEAKEKIAQAVAESLDGDQSTTSNVIHADFNRTTLPPRQDSCRVS
ncbi:helix-turn-helix domain-containing protein [Pseudomonas aeruginosa]|uniref:helix-turn-helix domain-containing protein n=1 Tax=Pseudomonas aeruginosa TaxID=287 RepID=UPI003F7E06EE